MEVTLCPSSSAGITVSLHLLSTFVISTVPSPFSVYSYIPHVPAEAEETENRHPHTSVRARIMVSSFFIGRFPFLFC